MPCVIIEPGPEHVDVGESEDCLNHLESEGARRSGNPNRGPSRAGDLSVRSRPAPAAHLAAPVQWSAYE
jgi:hypothetical protein